jgi:uncharacterized membrane protein HdeD (DUF308 family)
METKSFNKWGLLAVNGIIALVFGALAIFLPGPTLLTVVTYFGIVILLLGVAMLIAVINNIRNKLSYGLDLLETVFLLIIGFLLTFYSQKSLQVFVIIIGSWAILLGLLQIILSFKIDPGLSNKKTLLINGGISLIFGVILFFNPFQAAKFLLVLSGILAIVMGIVLIIVAFKMKNFKGWIEEEINQ